MHDIVWTVMESIEVYDSTCPRLSSLFDIHKVNPHSKPFDENQTMTKT